MRTVSFFSFFLLCSFLSAQTNPNHQKDPQALAVVQQALLAGNAASVQDLTASGTIAYYWGSGEVQGSAHVVALGADKFRIDTSIAGGTRSWWVGAGNGQLRDTDGKISRIPYENTLNLGALTFPLLRLSSLAQNTRFGLKYICKQTVDNADQFHLAINDSKESKQQPGAFSHNLQNADVFIDAASSRVFRIEDQTHPVGRPDINLPHAIVYSDYRKVNGVDVPFSISEYIGKARTWTLQLSQVSFNSGVSDSEFQF
jgi:hypothetical protein